MRRRFVMVEGELIEVSADYVQERDARASHNIIPDIEPFTSMVDGSLITSRSKKNAHYRAHNVIEVGNDPSMMNPVHKPMQSPAGLKELIARQVYQKLRY